MPKTNVSSGTGSLLGFECMLPGFPALSLAPELLSTIEELGFSTPTAVQSEAIPVLLAGRDIIAQSRTGSGKTLAFALPILERLAMEPRELQAMVLCPTRELSAQVAREFRKLGRRLPGLSVLVVAGGEPVRGQKTSLARGIHVLVGTPGRVLDLLRRRALKVHRVRTVVLDEADRMLSMGFRPDMESILKALPSPRQTMLFSATFPEAIDELSQRHQVSPVRIEGDAEPLPTEIRQIVYAVEEEQKLELLRSVLSRYAARSAIVFANFKATVAKLEAELLASGISAEAIHGDLEQFDRDRVMAKFRNASTRILVATDVAARGIDLQELDLVVNFELPKEPAQYVHRIGRTGRAGNAGLAVSFCTSNDRMKLDAIEQFTEVRLERVTSEPRRGSVRHDAEPAKAPVAQQAEMDTLGISGGRKDKLRPADILGALTGESGGLLGANIGKIEIHDRITYVAVSREVSQSALRSLNEGRIKGRKFKVTLVK